MNVYLSDNGKDLLPGDLVLRWVARSDLAPVPRTVEMALRLKDDIEAHFAVGKVFYTGREMLPYEVVKSHRKMANGVQGGDSLGVLEVTALLHSCARVSYRADHAVISRSARLGDVYRACGATARIADDFIVRSFACLAGDVPSVWLAVAMQEEGSCLVMRDGQLKITRLQDLFRQTPVDEIDATDTTDKIDSEFLERHEIPAFFSLDAAGGIVAGDFRVTRQRMFMPRSDERVLNNATRVLVTRRVVPSVLAEQINAGDLLRVNGANYAVITAAHWMEQNEGITETGSKFWVGDLSV